jgi:hypothetical protein
MSTAIWNRSPVAIIDHVNGQEFNLRPGECQMVTEKKAAVLLERHPTILSTQKPNQYTDAQIDAIALLTKDEAVAVAQKLMRGEPVTFPTKEAKPAAKENKPSAKESKTDAIQGKAEE